MISHKPPHVPPPILSAALLMGYLAFLAGLVSASSAGQVLFQDNFEGKLAPGWSWLREHREAWRVTARTLEVRIEPGNMWGPQNDARNVLLRPAPELCSGEITFSVQVENNPSHQYEQVDLVWYYNDSNMVKLGLELVDGKVSIVMGREEKDKTRTVALIPISSTSVRLRMFVSTNQIRGEFLPRSNERWLQAGQCDLPKVPGHAPQISLQFYQGDPDVEHWARVTDFRVERRP
jgi:regulation of enolase protein 1 (concanavalin A-like superfamily)